MKKKYIISGLVQGIGFRPSVKRIADNIGICGSVKNLGGSVEINAEGSSPRLTRFVSEICSIPSAVITDFKQYDVEEEKSYYDLFNGFEIIQSRNFDAVIPVLTPDYSVCDNCMREFYDNSNRRYMHPFISCTSCGPRYSLLTDIPYDRESIVMSDFMMCPECKAEYRDIKNIRCHAQTIACLNCGPSLSYTLNGNPLEEAIKTIKEEGVLAVKDIGGYHFACLASSGRAAGRIREIKCRETKPFAVMFNTVEQVRKYAYVSELEEQTLLSSPRPIVLLKKKRDFAPSVCSGSDYIGAFLPCNPVQHYLTKECGELVMTSANISGEPIITENEKIFTLRGKNGGFEILYHNRRIMTPLDDSVCRIICGKVQLMRRGRGYTPMPIDINMKNKKAALAAGGDLKASFCFAKDGRAYMSQYFGDLDNPSALFVWKNNIDRLGKLLRIRNFDFISDMHPLYHSSAAGKKYDRRHELQHHYAHMASVMAEHKVEGSALGFIFDGTGYGEDGNIWGGEAIKYDGKFTRAAHLSYTKVLGGDEMPKDSARILDCYLIAAGLKARTDDGSVIAAALEHNINTAVTSSMGRLFDAVSALLGICVYNSYEGECAVKLEGAAAKADKAYPLKLRLNGETWDTLKLIRDISYAYDNGEDVCSIALGFHKAAADAVIEFANTQNEKNIIISGGVFANRILTEMCRRGLCKNGYNVYMNEQVPMNDGGIALGQAWTLCNCT